MEEELTYSLRPAREEEGAHREIVLRADEAFGPRDPAGIDTVPRSAFPPDVELTRGQELML